MGTNSALAQDARPQSTVAVSGTASETVAPPSAKFSRKVSELIAQLGSTSFQIREHATSRLLEIGQPALIQLSALDDQELEIRLRAKLVADKIESRQFEVLSRSFLLDPAPEHAYGFPAWKPFSELVGHSRTSKLLFLEMIQSHPTLVELVDNLSKMDSPSAAEYGRLERQSAFISAEIANNRLTRMEFPGIGDITAILFAASFMPGQAPIEVNELLKGHAFQLPVSAYVRRRGYSDALRRLYAAWIPKTHAQMGSEAIGISLQYGLETGALIARKNLAPNLDVRTREQAIHCLARFGDKSDIARLAVMLDDDSTVQEFVGNQLQLTPFGRIEESNEPPPGSLPEESDPSILASGSLVRVNDLALAAICLLAEEGPESIFPGFVRNETYGFDSRSIAVPKIPQAQAARRDLIEQWKRRFSPSSG